MLDAGGIEIFAKALGYQDEVYNDDENILIKNPETAIAYGERKIREWVTEVTKNAFVAKRLLEVEETTKELFESIR
jgi:hypothetical protein